jgi:hypothetical protein
MWHFLIPLNHASTIFPAQGLAIRLQPSEWSGCAIRGMAARRKKHQWQHSLLSRALVVDASQWAILATLFHVRI